jgi:hypothetical protein
VYPRNLARKLPRPPAVPFDHAHPLGFKVATCPVCGSRCWVMGPARLDYPCARCVPENKWMSTVKRTRTKKAAAKPPKPRGKIARSATPRETRMTVRADYGQAPVQAPEAVATAQEHPAIGHLRAAYGSLSAALVAVEVDLPKQVTDAITAARATIASAADTIINGSKR